MGRSQVQYNRTHGRPGGRGKSVSRGGQGSPAKRHVVAGDNSWRYTNDHDDGHGKPNESNLLFVDEHHDVNVTSGGSYEHSNSRIESDLLDASTTEREWDIIAMSTALKTLHLHDLLRIPVHLTASIEGTPDNYENAHIVALATQRDLGDEAAATDKAQIDALQSAIHNNEEEDDMEAWLDSVIA